MTKTDAQNDWGATAGAGSLPASPAAAVLQPGPWVAYISPLGAHVFSGPDVDAFLAAGKAGVKSDREYDVTMIFDAAPGPEAAARAYLIGAAPELLAVCQAIELHCQGEGVGYSPEHRAEGVRLRERLRADIGTLEM